MDPASPSSLHIMPAARGRCCGALGVDAMKGRISFFLFVTLAASLANYLIVLGLTQVAVHGARPSSSLLVPVLWLITAPMNLLMSSSFGHSLSPTPLQVLFTVNSLLWGLAVGGVILWRRLRYE